MHIFSFLAGVLSNLFSKIIFVGSNRTGGFLWISAGAIMLLVTVIAVFKPEEGVLDARFLKFTRSYGPW